MNILYLKSTLVFWILQLCCAEEKCEPFHSISSEYTYPPLLLNLNCFSATNLNLDCVKKKLEKPEVGNNIYRIYIDECDDLKEINGTEILKALNLTSVGIIRYQYTSHNHKIERNVSVEHGIQELQIYNSNGAELDINLHEHYENIRELKLTTEAKEIPDQLISKLKHLKKLIYRSTMEVGFTQAAIAELPQLEYIELSLGCLDPNCKEFPLNFRNMSNLKKLELSSYTVENSIKEDLFENSRNLESLKITSNINIKKLPDNIFADQINLIRLDLRFNALETVQGQLFVSLKNLKYLDLSSNRIGEINWEWPLLPSLEELSLTPRLLKDIVGNVNIKLKSSNFKFIFFERQYSARTFTTDAFVCKNDDFCEFQEDRNGKKCPKACNCYFDRDTYDFIIDCAQKNLTEIPELPIPNIENVMLRIYHNHIKRLPNNSLYGYSNIVKLYAGSNEITSLSLEQIPKNIKVIDLDNNGLIKINDDVVNFLNQHKNIEWHWTAKVDGC